MTFSIGRGFAERQILKKVKMALPLELSGILWNTSALTLRLARSSPRDCEMSFVVGRGFAELQILKKVKMALSLELSRIL